MGTNTLVSFKYIRTTAGQRSPAMWQPTRGAQQAPAELVGNPHHSEHRSQMLP